MVGQQHCNRIPAAVDAKREIVMRGFEFKNRSTDDRVVPVVISGRITLQYAGTQGESESLTADICFLGFSQGTRYVAKYGVPRQRRNGPCGISQIVFNRSYHSRTPRIISDETLGGGVRSNRVRRGLIFDGECRSGGICLEGGAKECEEEKRYSFEIQKLGN